MLESRFCEETDILPEFIGSVGLIGTTVCIDSMRTLEAKDRVELVLKIVILVYLGTNDGRLPRYKLFIRKAVINSSGELPLGVYTYNIISL